MSHAGGENLPVRDCPLMRKGPRAGASSMLAVPSEEEGGGNLGL